MDNREAIDVININITFFFFSGNILYDSLVSTLTKSGLD